MTNTADAWDVCHYEPVGQRVGSVVMFCKATQLAAFDMWAQALAERGVEVRRYVLDALCKLAQRRKLSWPKPPKHVWEYQVYRFGVRPRWAVRQAGLTGKIVRRVLAGLPEPPDAAVVYGHSEVWYRAAAAMCRKLGVPVLHIEGAMFPRLSHLQHGPSVDRGHLIWTRGGAYYESWGAVDRAWHRSPYCLTPAEDERLDTYLEAWKANTASKLGQPRTTWDVRSSLWGRRLMFVPLQIDKDASLYFNTDVLVRRGVDVVQLLASVCDGRRWKIIVKLHPRGSVRAARDVWRVAGRYSHVQVVRDVNIHSLLRQADAVCGINSGVLLEACCYGHVPISLGSSCFAGRGFTLDVRSAEELRTVLDGETVAVKQDPRERLLFRRFLHMLFQEFFVDIDDFDAAKLVLG